MSQLTRREKLLTVFLLNRCNVTLRGGALCADMGIGRDEVASFANVQPKSIYPRLARLGRKLNVRLRWSNRGRPARDSIQQQRPAA